MSALPAFQLGYPQTTPELAFPKLAKAPVALTEKYRPRTLAGMLGQGAVVHQLESFLEAPHSCAFLFTGETGVGKTTAALAIAAELGSVEYGGLHHIKSGEQDGAAVTSALDALRYTPMVGSRWKVVIVDEADYMSTKAENLWLSALEDLPDYSIIVFTTNKPDRFAQRFLDRCERLEFTSDAKLVSQDAQTLVNTIWAAEVGTVPPPALKSLMNVVDSTGKISFRRVVRALEPIIRKGGQAQIPPPVATPARAPVPTPKPIPCGSSKPADKLRAAFDEVAMTFAFAPIPLDG